METLRKKLHTDDDILWLNHEKSLREQGIPDEQMLLLRKKLFFSDVNVDRNDPVQLNLMYIQVNKIVWVFDTIFVDSNRIIFLRNPFKPISAIYRNVKLDYCKWYQLTIFSIKLTFDWFVACEHDLCNCLNNNRITPVSWTVPTRYQWRTLSSWLLSEYKYNSVITTRANTRKGFWSWRTFFPLSTDEYQESRRKYTPNTVN